MSLLMRKKRRRDSTAGRYADEVAIVVAGYSGYPQPPELEEIWVFTVGVGAVVDFQAVVDDLEAKAEPHPFALQQRWSHFSWGADGAALRILLEMSTAIGGVAGVVYLAEKIVKGLRRYEAPKAVDLDRAAHQAKSQLAELLNLHEADVQVVEVRPKRGKAKLSFETPWGSFSGVAEPEGLIHLKRSGPRPKHVPEAGIEFEDADDGDEHE